MVTTNERRCMSAGVAALLDWVAKLVLAGVGFELIGLSDLDEGFGQQLQNVRGGLQGRAVT